MRVVVQDTTFEMERRRNRPEKYDREVVQNTVEALKRIKEIRVKRQEKFWEQRSVHSLPLHTTVHYCAPLCHHCVIVLESTGQDSTAVLC